MLQTRLHLSPTLYNVQKLTASLNNMNLLLWILTATARILRFHVSKLCSKLARLWSLLRAFPILHFNTVDGPSWSSIATELQKEFRCTFRWWLLEGRGCSLPKHEETNRNHCERLCNYTQQLHMSCDTKEVPYQLYQLVLVHKNTGWSQRPYPWPKYSTELELSAIIHSVLFCPGCLKLMNVGIDKFMKCMSNRIQ